ncbi:MAG: lytic murein transglycosylase [Vicinamibacterales bacterium]
MRLASALLACLLAAPQDALESPPPFNVWLTELVAEARARDYGEELVDKALAGLSPIERVIERDRTQAEVTITFDRYYASRVTRPVVRRGREAMRRHRTLLRRIERDFGVQARVVAAVWGLESRFGANTGQTPVFQALATLAWEPRRSAFFRSQLFNALTMVKSGYIDVDSMTGSWAGAMGQPQFMPSSYLEFAVDYDKDGRRDIWSSTPDVLASIANYLKAHGWTAERTWGREVRVSPQALARITKAVPARGGGCYARRTMTEWRPLAEWQTRGVRRVDGGRLPRAAVDAALVQTGARSFLVYPNYDALIGYNCAHHYALSVALLSDQLR